MQHVATFYCSFAQCLTLTLGIFCSKQSRAQTLNKRWHAPKSVAGRSCWRAARWPRRSRRSRHWPPGTGRTAERTAPPWSASTRPRPWVTSTPSVTSPSARPPSASWCPPALTATSKCGSSDVSLVMSHWWCHNDVSSLTSQEWCCQWHHPLSVSHGIRQLQRPHQWCLISDVTVMMPSVMSLSVRHGSVCWC